MPVGLGTAIAIEAGVGLTGAFMAKSATEKQTAAMQRIAAPGVAAQAYALPRLRDLIERVMMPQIDQRDPLLAIQHTMNLAGIGRTERVAEAEARFRYGSTGNAGRARGELLRIRQGAEAARGQERLGYGLAEEQRRDTALSRVTNALGALGGLGQVGVSGAMEAARAQGQGGRDFAADLVSSLTGVTNFWRNRDMEALMKRWLEKELNG